MKCLGLDLNRKYLRVAGEELNEFALRISVKCRSGCSVLDVLPHNTGTLSVWIQLSEASKEASLRKVTFRGCRTRI